MSINNFYGDFTFLSNFHPCNVTYKGLTYLSSESAFQAQKTLDPVEREKFTCMTASEAKNFGKKVDLRSDWEKIKVQTMYEIVMCKFSQNTDIKKKLLDTAEEELIEGNGWGDVFWGVCKGEGKNWLGKILMKVRKKLANPEVAS